MDLTKSFPRSPYDTNAGLVMLPRTTDKARAQMTGLLGEYHYDCPLDQRLFQFLGIDAESFLKQLKKVGTDDGMAKWIAEIADRSKVEREAFNNVLRHLRPEGDEGEQWLEQKRQDLGRADFHTYFDQLDADEGRF